ncbi:MAG: hypothetical protein JWN74_1249 [Acidobacteriaceae bacterium]|nr:hypothetical protein [Acidobacteriaceae bacterium]
MGLSSSYPSTARAIILGLAVLFSPVVSAQQSKVLAPHKPIATRVLKSREHNPAGVARSMVGGFWTIDANRKASIYLRNGLEESPITVTPNLYLSNGVRVRLAPITIAAYETAVVSINDALRQQGIAPWATLSGYIEVEYVWAWDPVCVTVTSTDPIHSLIFTSALQPSLGAALPVHLSKPKVANLYAVDGLWWKQEAGVSGFVALSNTTPGTVNARVQLSDNGNKAMAEYIVAVSPHGTKIVALDALNGTPAGSAGGLRILHDGTMEGLLISAGLQDETTGYSANIPFHYSFNIAPRQRASEDYAEIGLMTGSADPMMRFPASTVFTPFSIARNVSSQPISVSPTIYWMEGGKARSATLQSVSLLPFETRVIDALSLMRAAGLGNFNGSINLILSSEGSPNSLLLASGSVDQSHSYVFQVLPHGVLESSAKTISYWSTGNGDDTMVTVWNPADEAQDFVLTLFFFGGHYRLPMHLEARATRTFNISEIIETQVPDDEGNIVPPSVHEGSAKITGIHAENEQILVAVDAGTYNIRKATCSYYCISCDGAIAAFIGIAPFTMAQGSTNPLYFQIKTNTGSEYNSSGTWSSSKTSVATVNSSSGLVTGVAPGTSSLSAYDDFIDVYDSSYCNYNPQCPVQGYQSGSGTGNVAPPLTITYVAPSPFILGSSGIMTISGSGFTHYPGSPTINFDGGGISLASVSVVNDTTITANYSVACSAANQNLQVSFPSADSGTAQSNWWAISVSGQTPAPKIMFDGSDVTGATQSVVVGQQIALSVPNSSLPACVASQTWSTPPGTAVGGYNPTNTSATVTPISSVNINSQTYTFYWVDSSTTARKMTYYYTLSSGATSPVATTTFNVNGPTSPTMTVTPSSTRLQTVQDSTGASIQIATFGAQLSPWPTEGPGTPAGMSFGATITQPSGYSSANVQWVQIINSGSGKQINGSTTKTCPIAAGGDGPYPYKASSLDADDSPSTKLLTGTYTEETETVSYTMYLMWNSNLTNSISIALGHVDWTWSFDAKYTNNAWSLVSSSGGPSKTPNFTISSYFPRWSAETTTPVCNSN